MKKSLLTSFYFYCLGFITAANLSVLLPQAKDYDAHWWKVIVCSGAAIALCLSTHRRTQHERLYPVTPSSESN